MNNLFVLEFPISRLLAFIREPLLHLVFHHHSRDDGRVTFTVETEQETDGRWIAEIAQIPGALAYGATREEAIARVEALGLRVLAERIEQGETSPEIEKVFTVAA